MTSLDRQASCPTCGASVTFAFGGALAVVCGHCSDVVVRTDRGVHSNGRMAELLELPTPFTLGRSGSWRGDSFEVQGRVQMDRADQASAPWQEMLVWFSERDGHTWVAHAQGRWYATNETPAEGLNLPPFESLQPGGAVNLGMHGSWVVQEISQRRVVSGEGAMTNVPAPGVITRYADISAGEGRFGTIDYGDGSGAPELYLGRQFDPADVTFDDGMPLAAPTAEVTEVECPNCGASLPISSQAAERLICQYCGTASDMNNGALAALGPSPKPPVPPQIPIGTRGDFRGQTYVVAGFVVRSCVIDGVRYPWREYLLYGGPSVGYRWLMEEDGKWSFVEPVEAGQLQDAGHSLMFNGQTFNHSQTVNAAVECVIGEFYWKVEIGETVEATEWTGPGGKVSREKTAKEVNYTFVTPTNTAELAGFGLAPPPRAPGFESKPKRSVGKWLAIGCGFFVVLPFVGFLFLMGIAAATSKDFQDVLDGEVKLDGGETAAIKSMLKSSGMEATSLNVYDDMTYTCDWCRGVVVENGHVTLLRLESKRLKSVDGVGKLTKLKVLKVSNNALTEVKGMGALGELISADLSKNQIAKLESMKGCSKLQKLDLRDNKLASLSGVTGLPKLTELMLGNNPVTSVKGMSDLDALTTLDLKGAKLASFEGLGKLPKLQTLRAVNVGLTSLAGLEGLTGLTTLDVKQNRLTSLESLAPLPVLQTIYAGNNAITTVDGLERFPSLKTLNLDHNKLTSIEGKAGSTTLETLNVSHNQIPAVDAVAPYPKLRDLDVSHNQLAAMGAVAALAGLATLSITHNRLTTLGSMTSMSSLSKLNVANNQITTLEPLAGMSRLKDVDASNNRIVTSPKFMATPPTHYNLAGNPGVFPKNKRGRYAAPPPTYSSKGGKSSGYRGSGYRGGK